MKPQKIKNCRSNSEEKGQSWYYALYNSIYMWDLEGNTNQLIYKTENRPTDVEN